MRAYDNGRNVVVLGFLHRNLAFAPKSTKEAVYKTLVRPKLEYAHGLETLPQNFRKFGGQQPDGPAGDGETQVLDPCSQFETYQVIGQCPIL